MGSATIRTQVAIIGGGPSGLFLSHRLHLAGVDAVVLERRPRAHVLSRIRAGVLEWGTVEMLRAHGLAARMDKDGLVHRGVTLASANGAFRVDFEASGARRVMVYGQTALTEDLYGAADAAGLPVLDEAEEVAIHDLAGAPYVTFVRGGTRVRLDCDIIAGCDGFHGVSRRTIPADRRTQYERVYPFGWLGVLSDTPPVSDELIYANSPRGFALASMRSPSLSRYYIQVSAAEDVASWTADAFWDELRRRLPDAAAETLITGAARDMSIAPLRSFVCEPMRYGPLCLAGDAAHIVPPTGAKGLNLALSDVHYLAEALEAALVERDGAALDACGARALQRVWKAIRFSFWLTALMLRFDGETAFEQRLQEAELATMATSPQAQAAFAEGYTGYPV